MRRLVNLGLALFVIGLSACVDKGDEGMFIVKNTAPPSGGTSCTLTVTSRNRSSRSGAISYYAAAAGQGYIFTPLIESRITATDGNVGAAHDPSAGRGST